MHNYSYEHHSSLKLQELQKMIRGFRHHLDKSNVFHLSSKINKNA